MEVTRKNPFPISNFYNVNILKKCRKITYLTQQFLGKTKKKIELKFWNRLEIILKHYLNMGLLFFNLM